MIGETDADLRGLLTQHRDLVLGSGIAPNVAVARGYRSATVRSEWRRLGFSDVQSRVPALLIPLHGVAGGVVGYQLRPDEPRIRDGKALKYEFPAGSRMVLDVHPHIRDVLGDPSAPLWITEGVRKGDAAVSIGLCCIALLGVWNFRGTNERGGKTTLPDWDAVALNGRDVFVAFDSDVMLKTAVHDALARLGGFLASRSANMRYVYLPSGSGGAKVGLDDYIATGRSVDDLIALASTELRRPVNESDDADRSYVETAAGLIWRKPVQGGTVDVPLADFTAKIVGDVVEDDGAEERRFYEIEAVLDGRVQRVTIPASQFASMSWVGDRLGAAARVWPGIGLKDHLRFAIQVLSDAIPSRHVYAHTGWRLIDGKWIYLHAGGGIGADGLTTGIEVALSGPFARFRLPDPPDGAPLVGAVGACLALLDLLPQRVVMPLIASAWLAPLHGLLSDEAPDFVVWLHGPSGTYKSETIALAQALFGDFSRQSLPASFAATPNAIERLAFIAKDALLAIDDYHPAGDLREAQAMNQVANRLLRGVGNGSGRARMKADTSLRAALAPRCVPVVSGERLPEGHSNTARMFSVAVEPNSLPVDRLTMAQEQRRLYPLATAAYLRYIAGRFEAFRETLPDRFRALRRMIEGIGGHRREPGQIAHLLLGLETYFDFAVEIGAMRADERDDRLQRARLIFLEHAREHADMQDEGKPEQVFLRLLGDGFAGKRAYLEDKRGGPPDDAQRWGWEIVTRQDQDGEERAELRHNAAAQLVGVLDGEWLLLFPEAVFQFVSEAARRSGKSFPVESKTLIRRLAEARLIATDTESGQRRLKINAWIGGETRRVIKLRREALSSSPASSDREDREDGERASSRASAVHSDVIPFLPGLPGFDDERSPSDNRVDEEIVEWTA